jgi:hypothetical protein
MTGLLFLQQLSHLRAGEQRYNITRNNKSQEAQEEPFPMTAGNKVESGKGYAKPQKQTAKEPESRPFGGYSLADRPPEAAKEYCSYENARY